MPLGYQTKKNPMTITMIGIANSPVPRVAVTLLTNNGKSIKQKLQSMKWRRQLLLIFS